MTVQNIFDFLNKLYPVSTACSFDNPGFLVGDGEKEVKKAVISLDCTFDTVRFASENGADLIITHHPVIFSPLKKVKSGSIVFELIKNGISVISMHTNLDIAEGGVNDTLCEVLELSGVENQIMSDNYALNFGFVNSLSAEAFAKMVKEKLGGVVKFVDGKKPINKVFVCSGSGASYLNEVAMLGADAFLTADIKHNLFLEAKDMGISLFDAGHFNTEDVVVEKLNKVLSQEFNGTEFLEYHHSDIEFI